MKRLYRKLIRWVFKKLNIMTAERFQEMGAGIAYGLNDLLSTTNTPQRSETMETYSTLEAMQKAKEDGTTFTCDREYRGKEVKLHHRTQPADLGEEWIIATEDEVLPFIPDVEWQKEQPGVQVGDWFQSKNTGVYFNVIGLSASYEQNYKLKILNGMDDARMKASEIKEHGKKITDERALMFLNGGRKPDGWKDDDIATDGVSLYTIGYDWHEDSAREQQFLPVCFAESRVDGGDTP